MPKNERLEITDPQRIRAMTHPLRIELLDILSMVSEATATECAERTGESVASCSFHLRMLAKYGYVEPGEPRGREKPWRLASRSRTIGPDVDNPESIREASAFARAVVEQPPAQDVVARLSENHIPAPSAVNDVVPVAAEQDVVARAALQRYGQ
jgi:DNA-binding transcriptional ArsR family regulator